MNEVDVAWAAGLFEGEGSVGAYIKKRGNKFHCEITLQITMCDWEPLYRFADIFDLSQVNGPYVRNPKWKPAYMYQLNTLRDVQYVMDLILPYLYTRRKKQYEEALEKYNNFKDKSEQK